MSDREKETATGNTTIWWVLLSMLVVGGIVVAALIFAGVIKIGGTPFDPDGVWTSPTATVCVHGGRSYSGTSTVTEYKQVGKHAVTRQTWVNSGGGNTTNVLMTGTVGPDGNTMVFDGVTWTRQVGKKCPANPAAVAAVVIPPFPSAAPSGGDATFDGRWSTAGCISNGMIQGAQSVGANTVITYTKGTVAPNTVVQTVWGMNSGGGMITRSVGTISTNGNTLTFGKSSMVRTSATC